MKKIATYFTLIISFLIANSAIAQLDLGNEEIVYSFKTEKGKSVVLCVTIDKDYMIYRYGTDEKVELEFPNILNETSFTRFKYYYLHRGGGPQNAGMDMNYIVFKNGSYKYVIYDEIDEDVTHCGIRVTDEKTGKTTDIKGIFSTRTGTLTDFRTNELVEVFEEML